MNPIRLVANRPRRFYRGGAAIARFRGLPPDDDHVPEDWVGSTTAIFGSEPSGLTVVDHERLLRDAVAAEPEAFLGPAHVRRFGADPAVLVKLLDAGERLPVHAHPDHVFAREHLSARHGKSEAWLILAVEGEPGLLHVGFRDDVDAGTLADWALRQDGPAMIAAMNEVAVAPGDCVYVPAGTPHSIGEGVFMIEIQEPSDLSVLLEWSSFGLAPEVAHIGLGLEVALSSVRRRAVRGDELAAWMRGSADAPETRAGARSVVVADAEQFFRAEWLRPDPSTTLEPAYSILVTVGGAGRLVSEEGELELAKGDTVLIPYAAGAAELHGPVEVVRCLPPRADEARS